ncbi:hypothetical protein M8C21_031927, partial [Ambrosia artemisiifolia]
INGFIEGTQPEELVKLLLSLATKWGDVIDMNKIKVVHLSGAMTNVVYRITWPKNTTDNNDERTVLVRFYGEGSDVFFDREEEIRTFESISTLKHGPRLLAQFPEGRVEEFIHAKDYEYASYNPVAYDLANHFCEWAANYHTDTPHVLDYNMYPGLEDRQRFVQSYLSSTGNQPCDGEVDQLIDDIEKYTLANHLFWGLWGIISGYVTHIDFDYIEYARQRFSEYWLKKPQLLTGKMGTLRINDLVDVESKNINNIENTRQTLALLSCLKKSVSKR